MAQRVTRRLAEPIPLLKCRMIRHDSRRAAFKSPSLRKGKKWIAKCGLIIVRSIMPTQQSFFHRAVVALRNGNPYPMLSRRATFDSEAMKAHWRRKADLMEDVVTSIHNRIVNIKL